MVGFCFAEIDLDPVHLSGEVAGGDGVVLRHGGAGVSTDIRRLAAKSGTEALIAAVTAVRGERESRSRLRLNLTALLLTIAGIVSGAIALAALFALPSS